jgi:hypothetical protein
MVTKEATEGIAATEEIEATEDEEIVATEAS